MLEKTRESPLDCKEIQPVHPKGNQSWIFTGRTDVEAETPILCITWCKERTPWKRPWCGERLKAGGEGDDRGWDGWMASPIQWTWIWVNSGSWWWTGRPVMLQSMGSQRIGHDCVTKLNWTELNCHLRGMLFLLNWPFPFALENCLNSLQIHTLGQVQCDILRLHCVTPSSLAPSFFRTSSYSRRSH